MTGVQTCALPIYTPFDGLLDYWRVSDGVLAPDDFLYVNIPKGTLILFK